MLYCIESFKYKELTSDNLSLKKIATRITSGCIIRKEPDTIVGMHDNDLLLHSDLQDHEEWIVFEIKNNKLTTILGNPNQTFKYNHYDNGCLRCKFSYEEIVTTL